ncbi:MAG: hypothetical protein BWK80_09390 [Desulfobacteraceae bacterium IS3]|nr:MAG: hypothetical protein BWK80_09390 [Desulfobacteraceae bacterium IS3]
MSKSDKKEIHLEKEMGTAEVINYLEEIIRNLKERNVVIEQGDVFISMMPTEVIDVDIKAKQKKRKAKLSLELSWTGIAD